MGPQVSSRYRSQPQAGFGTSEVRCQHDSTTTNNSNNKALPLALPTLWLTPLPPVPPSPGEPPEQTLPLGAAREDALWQALARTVRPVPDRSLRRAAEGVQGRLTAVVGLRLAGLTPPCHVQLWLYSYTALSTIHLHSAIQYTIQRYTMYTPYITPLSAILLAGPLAHLQQGAQGEHHAWARRVRSVSVRQHCRQCAPRVVVTRHFLTNRRHRASSLRGYNVTQFPPPKFSDSSSPAARAPRRGAVASLHVPAVL